VLTTDSVPVAAAALYLWASASPSPQTDIRSFRCLLRATDSALESYSLAAASCSSDLTCFVQTVILSSVQRLKQQIFNTIVTVQYYHVLDKKSTNLISVLPETYRQRCEFVLLTVLDSLAHLWTIDFALYKFSHYHYYYCYFLTLGRYIPEGFKTLKKVIEWV